MEESLQSSKDQITQTPMEIQRSYLPPKQKSNLLYILIMIIVAISAGALYFYNQSRSLNSQSTTNASPSSVTSPTDSSDILEIIPTLTSPMVWSKPIESTLMDAGGYEIPGMLISSKVASKQENKFAGLLVTDTPLVKQYGWAEHPQGIADGMGESISTYTKNNQKLIIRYKDGEYKVLLTK